MSTAEIATLNGTAAPAAPKTATFASFINGATTGPLLILWAYLAYWAAVVIYFFDKIDPQLWVNSLIVAVFIGVALNAAVRRAAFCSAARCCCAPTSARLTEPAPIAARCTLPPSLADNPAAAAGH